MRILAFGDLHLRDYKLYNSDKSQPHLPDRLLLYLTLAQDIQNVARAENCPAIIIAGDILDVHTNTPSVLNVLKEFFSILTEYCHVYVTHGQHDIATKTVDDNIKQLTSLNLFHNLTNGKVHYYHDEVVGISSSGEPVSLSEAEVSVYFYGWTPLIPPYPMKNADIFIGHNMVSSSTDYFGYEFSNGYDPIYLSQTYKYSVLGDIHNSQIIRQNILVPGPPIQNKFRDSPVNGVWVLNTDVYQVMFFEIKSPAYPKFYLVPDKSKIPEISPPNHYYKLISRSTADQLTDDIRSTATSVNLWNLIEELIKSKKIENETFILEIARHHYENSALDGIEGRHLPPVLIQRVSIKNFISIQEYDFDITQGLTLLIGNIGSGKSSLLESIPYALYGKTSKAKYKEEIIPNSFEGEPEVTIYFTSGETECEITRGMGRLGLRINKKEVSGSRMSETQVIINDLIGLTYDEFSSLVFFAQDTGSFFGRMSEEQQMSLMTLFLGSHTERVSKLNEIIFENYKKFKANCSENEQRLKLLHEQETTYETNLGQIEVDKIDIRCKQREFLSNINFLDASNDVIDLLIQGKIIESANLYFRQDYNKLVNFKEQLLLKKVELSDEKADILANKRLLENKLFLLSQKTTEVEQLVNSYEVGVCPECQQTLPDSTEKVEHLTQEYQQLSMQFDEVSSQLNLLSTESYETKLQKIATEIDRVTRILTDYARFMKCERISFNRLEELKLLKSMLAENEVKVSSTTAKLIELKRKFECYNFLHKQIFCDNGLKSKCIESVGSVMSNNVNQLLQNIGLDVTVDIKTVRYKKGGGFDSGFDVSAFFDGCETSYRMASGGQKMIIDLASIVSIYNLLSSMYILPHGVMGLICFDELIMYLDDHNLDAVTDLLDQLNTKSKFLVSHDAKLKQLMCDRVISVQRNAGISVYS